MERKKNYYNTITRRLLIAFFCLSIVPIVGRSRSAAGINYRVVYLYNHSIPGAYNHKGVCHESKRKETI